MRAVVLITIINILKYGSSYPLQEPTNSEKCLADTPERQNQINSIIQQIGNVLNNLSKQYEDIEISDVKLTVNRYADASKPKETDLTIVVNDCGASVESIEDTSELRSGENYSIQVRSNEEDTSSTSEEFNFDSTDLSYFNDGYENATLSSAIKSKETPVDGQNQQPRDTNIGVINQNVNEKSSVDRDNGITIAFLIDDVIPNGAGVFNTNGKDGPGKRTTVAFLSEEKTPGEIDKNSNIVPVVSTRPDSGLEVAVVRFTDQEDQVLNELEKIRGHGPFLMFERPHLQRFIF